MKHFVQNFQCKNMEENNVGNSNCIYRHFIYRGLALASVLTILTAIYWTFIVEKGIWKSTFYLFLCNSYAVLSSCIQQGRNCIVYCSLSIKGLEFNTLILHCLCFDKKITFWCVLLRIPSFWRIDHYNLKNRMMGCQHSWDIVKLKP